MCLIIALHRSTASSRSITSDYGGSTPSLKMDTSKKTTKLESIKEMPEVPEVAVYSTHTRHQPAKQFRHLNLEPKVGKQRYSDDKEKNKHLKWTNEKDNQTLNPLAFLNFLNGDNKTETERKKEHLPRKTEPVQKRSVSSSSLNKTRKEGCREDKTNEPVPKKCVSCSSLNKTRKEDYGEDKTNEPVPKKSVSSMSLNKRRKEGCNTSEPVHNRSVSSSSLRNPIKDGFILDKTSVNLNVVDKHNEKKLNQELIENYQEQIIEHEEDVPAYKNMPWEETLKPEKARRRLKPEIEGNNQEVQCPYCTRRTRTKEEMMKHLEQIHVCEIMREYGESENITPFSPEYKQQLQNLPYVQFKATENENHYEVLFHKNMKTDQTQESRNKVNANTIAEMEPSSSCSKNGMTKNDVAAQTRYEHKDGNEARTTIHGSKCTLDKTSFKCSSNTNTDRPPNVADIGNPKNGSRTYTFRHPGSTDMIDKNVNQTEHERNSSFETDCKVKERISNQKKLEKTRYKSDDTNITDISKDMTFFEALLNPSNRKKHTLIDQNNVVSEGDNSLEDSGIKRPKHKEKQKKGFLHNLTKKLNKFFSRD